MDLTLIEGLSVQCVIGVFEWEKQIKQTLVFDLEMAADITKAAAGDDLNFAINYAAVSDTVTEFCHNNTFELIETVAERLCQVLLAQYALTQITMTLRKPGAVPTATSVGVKITRRAN
jgi:7,8-dihydroneopterin aldolase/epimerase/oxygenase